MEVLITGVAGFIGFHLAVDFLKNGHSVIGIDNLNSYYDVSLKKSRLDLLFQISRKMKIEFNFFRYDLVDRSNLENLFKDYKPKYVINLAAQAGVRYSIENPTAYIQSNLNGFFNILDISSKYGVEHFLYASSSSVYGGNIKLPFSEIDPVDHPVSLYAATKKSNELIAHTYSHLFKTPTTGLRFFTVYGPWGRPDMALFLFTDAMLNGKEIDIFNNGEMIRDFTYIEDVVKCVSKLVFKPSLKFNNDKLSCNNSSNSLPYEIYNIGNSNPIPLMSYITALEKELGIKAKKNFMKMQDGDVLATSADTSKIQKAINFKPSTSIETGIREFVKWYKIYYKIN